MKIVALDVGEKRIGVATADTSVKIAVPHSTITVDGTEFQQIADILRFEGAKHLVVGLPRNGQGKETAQSESVRNFIISLRAFFVKHKLDIPLIKFQDESLTSVLAEEHLSQNKRKKRQKADIDKEAATLILQDFLDSFAIEAQKPASHHETPAPHQKPTAHKSKKKSKMRHKILTTLAFIIALIVVGTVGAIAWYSHMTSPISHEAPGCPDADNPSCTSIEFEVREGELTEEIAGRLESKGIIRSAFAFKVYLRLERQGTVLRTGTYRLDTTMSMSQIVDTLQQGSQAPTFQITFLPGATLADAKKRLLAVGYSESDIDEAFAAEYPHPLLRDKPDCASLEGYIYGETYEFYETATVGNILMRTFDEMYKVIVSNDLTVRFAERDLNIHEGITLASIIQREAQAIDQPGVAQVFLLRLERGIVLGSDAVIGYAADQIDPDRNKSDMSYLTSIQCPWNSRRCAGLPPTPIASPSKSALLAVVNPAEGDYIYFVTGDDGITHFARTEAEHNQNVRNYCKIRCNFY